MLSFSVIIPTRDRPVFLREAVRSVMEQSAALADVIVVDDGEGAAEAVTGLGRRVRLLDNQRLGPVRARQLGVEQAQAEGIAFLDDDDRWIDRDFLSRAAAAMGDGADLCFGDGRFEFDDGRPPLAYAFDADSKSLERDNTILVSAVAYRRSLHSELGLFDETLPYYWDWDWYLRVARAGKRLHHIKSPVAAIRVHSANMSGGSLADQRLANLEAFATKHSLPPIALKNHLSLVTDQPPDRT